MGLYDELRDCVGKDKWSARCVRCGEEHLKKRMTTVLFRAHYQNPKTGCFLCEPCLAELCDQYEISM